MARPFIPPLLLMARPLREELFLRLPLPILDSEWTFEFFNVAIFQNFWLLGVILNQIPKNTRNMNQRVGRKLFLGLQDQYPA